jgi:hypothetical protein
VCRLRANTRSADRRSARFQLGSHRGPLLLPALQHGVAAARRVVGARGRLRSLRRRPRLRRILLVATLAIGARGGGPGVLRATRAGRRKPHGPAQPAHARWRHHGGPRAARAACRGRTWRPRGARCAGSSGAEPRAVAAAFHGPRYRRARGRSQAGAGAHPAAEVRAAYAGVAAVVSESNRDGAMEVVLVQGAGSTELRCPRCGAPGQASASAELCCAYCGVVSMVSNRAWQRLGRRPPEPSPFWVLFQGASPKRQSLTGNNEKNDFQAEIRARALAAMRSGSQ